MCPLISVNKHEEKETHKKGSAGKEIARKGQVSKEERGVETVKTNLRGN